MDKKKQILLPFKHVRIKQTISPHISSLLEKSDLNISSQKIITVTNTIRKDLLQGFKLLVTIDKGIGGVGLYNVNKKEGDEVTGAYRIKFRGIFRPLQYIYADLGEDDLLWNARDIVQNSCLHVEKAMKFRFDIPEFDGSSLGVLLWKKTNAKSILDTTFFEILTGLNEKIYTKNKHTIEHIKMDDHDYSPPDAIAIYLISRWAGVKLLEPTGILNDWEGD
jgi:hypothetical protein